MRIIEPFVEAQRQAALQPMRVAAAGRLVAAGGRAAICATAEQQQRRQQPSVPLQHQQRHQQQRLAAPSRRALLTAAPTAALALVLAPRRALAIAEPPPGFRLQNDKLDGYSFFYPEDWQLVTTSGNDIFFRNPFNVEENLFVDVSSPSSSRYESVANLGSPNNAAQRTLDQYLEEFMSTRLGVRRSGEIVSARSRTGADGRLYYDVEARVRSYASRNQLAVTQAEVDEGVELEWDRIYLAVLGVANRRLYQFRLQSSAAAYARDAARLAGIAASFECRDV